MTNTYNDQLNKLETVQNRLNLENKYSVCVKNGESLTIEYCLYLLRARMPKVGYIFWLLVVEKT